MITIYLGDVGEYLAELVVANHGDATLITHENFSNLPHGNYYTSIGDLVDLRMLGDILQQASRIVYAPPTIWSDDRHGESKMKEWTEDYLNIFRFRCHVDNYNPVNTDDRTLLLNLIDSRKTQSHQLWIAGCSVSHGIGVTKDTRFGKLLAEKLNLEVSFLTWGSSSILWAADQILRSDIRSGDIVVWGLTSWSRQPFYNNHTLTHVTPSTFLKSPNLEITPETLTSDNLFYQTLTSVFQVINFCQKIGAKLVIASILDDCIVSYLDQYPNLIMLYHMWGRNSKADDFVDIGSDDMHPGVKTHQFYADQIYQKIQNLVATE